MLSTTGRWNYCARKRGNRWSLRCSLDMPVPSLQKDMAGERSRSRSRSCAIIVASRPPEACSSSSSCSSGTEHEDVALLPSTIDRVSRYLQPSSFPHPPPPPSPAAQQPIHVLIDSNAHTPRYSIPGKICDYWARPEESFGHGIKILLRIKLELEK